MFSDAFPALTIFGGVLALFAGGLLGAIVMMLGFFAGGLLGAGASIMCAIGLSIALAARLPL